MKNEKRKGYKTIEQQIEANKRYLENNEKAKKNRKIIVARSQAKKFINDFASLKELEEFEKLIKARKLIIKK